MLSKSKPTTLELFKSHLSRILSHDHPLYKLAGQIDWSVFESAFGSEYSPGMGRPSKPIRLLVGLHYLKHAFDESDESVVARWLENPYWQWFCGMEYFRHELPCDPTLLVKWRHRVGAEKLEKLIAETVSCALREKLVTETELSFVNVDTTVQEKNIAYPTDSRLYDKCRIRLVRAAQKRGIKLHRYASVKKFKDARRMTRSLKTYLRRVVRSIRREIDPADGALLKELELADRLLSQQRNSNNKIYSLHEPEVRCIAKGKAHKKFEFGCKIGVVATSVQNWIVGVKAFEGNPYDGHTIADTLAAMRRVTGMEPLAAYCDKGYRGAEKVGETKIRVAGTGPRKKHPLHRFLAKRRSSIEPTIGHLKSDNRMGRNYLKGTEGDRINAILAAAGYNIRKLLRAFFLPFLLWWQIIVGDENHLLWNREFEVNPT